MFATLCLQVWALLKTIAVLQGEVGRQGRGLTCDIEGFAEMLIERGLVWDFALRMTHVEFHQWKQKP